MNSFLPNIVFRTDASLDIGTGHVMRCLTLADALDVQGYACHFICRDFAGNLIDYIQMRGFTCNRLPATSDPVKTGKIKHSAWLGISQDDDAMETTVILEQLRPEWMIIDHYAIDITWEKQIEYLCKHTLVIDDLADRPHDCAILLDQNLGRNSEDYHELVLANSTCLLGPKYALLRPEFAAHRAESLRRRKDSSVEHILISMGGVDRDNVTGRLLASLAELDLPQSMYITVVLGRTSPWIDDISAQAAKMAIPTTVVSGVDTMAQLMSQADLAIGAAGSTSWERCCLGLLTIIAVLADNQLPAATEMARKNVAILLQNACEGDLTSEISSALEKMQNDRFRENMTTTSAALVDGNGVERVVSEMLERGSI